MLEQSAYRAMAHAGYQQCCHALLNVRLYVHSRPPCAHLAHLLATDTISPWQRARRARRKPVPGSPFSRISRPKCKPSHSHCRLQQVIHILHALQHSAHRQLSSLSSKGSDHKRSSSTAILCLAYSTCLLCIASGGVLSFKVLPNMAVSS